VGGDKVGVGIMAGRRRKRLLVIIKAVEVIKYR
jgi:hypothetical protein